MPAYPPHPIFIESARVGGIKGGGHGNSTGPHGGVDNHSLAHSLAAHVYSPVPSHVADGVEEFFTYVEAVFTLLYSVEMILKVWTYGCGGYWRDSRHRFDGIITLASTCYKPI